VTLNWSGNSVTNSLQVWRDGVMLTTLAGTANSYVDNTVTAIVSYSYTIVAVNAFGSNTSAPLTVITPMIPVAAPTGLTATVNNAGTQATVRWTDNANNDTSYTVEVSSDNGATFGVPLVVNSSAAQRTAINRTVTLTPNVVTVPGSIYVFKVTAVNVTGTATSTSPSVSVTLDLSAPVALTAPVAVAGVQTATRAPLSWAAVVPPVTTPATTVSYVVQVSANGGTPVALAQQNGLTANPVIAAGNSYTLQVLSQATRFGLTTKSGLSNTLTVQTPPAASSTPVATAGAAATQVINVNWTNPSANITGWTVQRRPNNGLAALRVWSNIAPTVTGTGTAYGFTDTAPLAGGNYSYRVTATSAVGTSGPVTSNAITAP
jgi:fibronectin type 3 domain-containing protein